MKIANVLLACSMVLAIAHQADALTLEGSVSKSDTEGEGRIGVRMSWHGRVARVHAGSPAASAGLMKNDKVMLVDGRKYRPGRIAGEPGTAVVLDIKRMDQVFQVAVERIDEHEIYY